MIIPKLHFQYLVLGSVLNVAEKQTCLMIGMFLQSHCSLIWLFGEHSTWFCRSSWWDSIRKVKFVLQSLYLHWMCDFDISDSSSFLDFTSNIFSHDSNIITFNVLFHHVLYSIYNNGSCNDHVCFSRCRIAMD